MLTRLPPNALYRSKTRTLHRQFSPKKSLESSRLPEQLPPKTPSVTRLNMVSKFPVKSFSSFATALPPVSSPCEILKLKFNILLYQSRRSNSILGRIFGKIKTPVHMTGIFIAVQPAKNVLKLLIHGFILPLLISLHGDGTFRSHRTRDT